MLGIYGIFDEDFGYGRGTVALLKAAALAGIPYKTYAIPHKGAVLTEPVRKLMARSTLTHPQTILAHCTPPQLKLLPKVRDVAIYSMFERSALPTRAEQGFGEDWVSTINERCFQVFTPTQFPADVMRSSGVIPPARVLPYGMQFEDIEYRERTPKDMFTVVTYGELVPRKGADLAIEAFKRAFPTERNVQLILKTYGGAGASIRPMDNRIYAINANWPRERLLRWLQNADCFLWLSRGEGLSLPPMEAISSGLPAVISANTGMLDWQTPDMYTVPCRETPAPDVGNWFEADVDIAAAYLRQIFECRSEATERTERAAASIAARYTMRASAEALASFVTSLDNQ